MEISHDVTSLKIGSPDIVAVHLLVQIPLDDVNIY